MNTIFHQEIVELKLKAGEIKKCFVFVDAKKAEFSSSMY